MIPFLPVHFCLIDIALSQGSMVWVGGLEGERGSGEVDQGEHNLALPRIVESGPEHLKILKINLGFVSLLDYEGGLLDRILWKMVQQRSFCASKIIRLMFVIVFISFSIYCTNQIVGKNIGIVAQQWWTLCKSRLLVFLNLLWLSRETRLNLFILQNSENIVLNYGPSADC